MEVQSLCAPFKDTPEMEQVEAVINTWQRLELPDQWKYGVRNSGGEGVVELSRLVKASLAKIQSSRQKSWLEIKLISWLYDFIKGNVKRGRVFDLGEVLLQGSADCLGYAKLFTLLGRLFGLDVGVVEVVRDNAGRHVPHTAALVRLSDRQLRFIDLWYGSKNISHKRIGLQVKRGGVWKIEDLELKELGKLEEVCYLPDSCIDAITTYIRGNRHLNRQEFATAIECYSQALRLYPNNARFHYNRAIAYENMGEHEKASADYAQALCDNAAIIRLLAREHEEVISLLDLDAKAEDNLGQEMYLLYKGFVTGKKVPLLRVARKFGLSETETKAMLSSVEAGLVISSE